jgi:hypothetical protein
MRTRHSCFGTDTLYDRNPHNIKPTHFGFLDSHVPPPMHTASTLCCQATIFMQQHAGCARLFTHIQPQQQAYKNAGPVQPGHNRQHKNMHAACVLLGDKAKS